jgi:hypothetical protein
VCSASTIEDISLTTKQELLPSPDSLVTTVLYRGSGSDRGTDIAVDDDGFIYLVGTTESMDFPIVNAMDDSHNGETDCFLMKLDSDLETIIYSTYIGGAGSDEVSSLTLGLQGDIFIAGCTKSSDFPVTNNVSSASIDEYDAFLMKLSSLDGSLSFSTLLGGSEEDVANGISVDAEGNVHIVGTTYSEDFILRDPVDSSLNGEIDCFWTVLSPNGSLLFSSYIGGSNQDYGYDIDIGPEEMSSLWVHHTRKISLLHL